MNINFNWTGFIHNIVNKIGYDGLVDYQHNENNQQVTTKIINNILKKYDIHHQVNDIELFEIALTHESYIKKNFTEIKNIKSIFMGIKMIYGDELKPISPKHKNFIKLKEISYERLEFIGDSIIRLVLSLYAFLRFPEMQEGNLTKLRSQIENSEGLAKMTRSLGLQKYILLSRNNEVIMAREKNENIQCDVFEAFIAALYLDVCNISYKDIGTLPNILDFKNNGTGYQICYNFITKLIENEIDITYLLENNNNYKDTLLQVFHEYGWSDPLYDIIETIIDNDKIGKRYFKMCVKDNDKKIIGWGIGASKQKGEKLAAKMALQYLKVIPHDCDDVKLDKTSNLIYHRILPN